jgi:hypothetical protein
MRKLAVFIFLLLAVRVFAQTEVEVIGIGSTFEKAKINAFTIAVEQAIGVLISSELIIKNGELIEENITAKSQGFVEKYTILSTSYKGGNVEVAVKAVVSQAKLAKELEIITGTKIDLEGKNITASVQTKKILYDDLLKEFPQFLKKLEPELKSAYTVEIETINFNHEQLAKTVPFEIKFKANINYDVYNEAIGKLEQRLTDLGALLNCDREFPTVRLGEKDIIIVLMNSIDRTCQYVLNKQLASAVSKFLDAFNSRGSIVIKFMDNENVLEQYKISKAAHYIFYNGASLYNTSSGNFFPVLSPDVRIDSNTLTPIKYADQLKTFSGKINLSELDKMTAVTVEVVY